MTKKGATQPCNGRSPLPQGIRFNVLRRDNFTCRYCGRSSPAVVLHVDHKHPISRGGADTESNLVTSCEDCNFGKRAKTAVKVPVLRRPVEQSQVGMVGMFGLSYENRVVNHQFSIERAIGDDLYAVQLYSWLDGVATDTMLMDGPSLRSARCRLFLTAEEWRAAATQFVEEQRDETRERLRAEGLIPVKAVCS